MESFLQYWEHVSSLHRMIYLLAGIVLFWILEGYYPLFRFSYRRYRHAGINFVFLGTTIVLNLVFGLGTLWVCRWVTAHHFGLFQWVRLPFWALILAGLLFGDLFSQYIPHVLMHRVRWMWKFHMVHHSDTHVDVTTGTRHHPGEWLFRESSLIIGVVLLGMPVWMYFFYRSASAVFTYFIHANMVVPQWLDRPLSWFFISPNMHKVHHHYMRPYTDSNYGNIVSVWDRLFGTFRYADPKTLRYGLDVLENTDDEDLGFQFGLPLNKNVKTDY